MQCYSGSYESAPKGEKSKGSISTFISSGSVILSCVSCSYLNAIPKVFNAF